MTDRQSNGPADTDVNPADGGPVADADPAQAGDTSNGRLEDAPEAAAVSSDDDPPTGDTAVLEDLEAALETTRIELDRTRDRFVRLAAEFDNYRKRTEREKLDAYARAQADLIARMLDAVDDLERVADFDENTPSKALLEGVQLVEKKLLAAFEAVGLRRLDAAGKPFDPLSMEALATVPTEDPAEDEKVSDVFQAGYRFGELLVRPARVRVKKLED
jgi:molecular chaperone GrpE